MIRQLRHSFVGLDKQIGSSPSAKTCQAGPSDFMGFTRTHKCDSNVSRHRVRCVDMCGTVKQHEAGVFEVSCTSFEPPRKWEGCVDICGQNFLRKTSLGETVSPSGTPSTVELLDYLYAPGRRGCRCSPRPNVSRPLLRSCS